MKNRKRTQDDLVRELVELRSKIEALQESAKDEEASQQRSRLSEERYRKIFQYAPVSIWEEDFSELKASIDRIKASGYPDFREFLAARPEFVAQAAGMIRVTDVNQETLNMNATEDKSVLLGAPARVLPRGAAEAFREEILAIADGKSIFEAEGVTHTLDGKERHVLVRIAIPSDPESFKSLLVTLLDITERRNAEEELRRSEERFRALFQAAPDCIYIKDCDLRYTHVNPAMCSLMGMTPSQLVGRAPEEVYGEHAGRHVSEVDRRVLKGEAVEEEHSRPIRGEWRTFHDIRAPLVNSNLEIIGLCGISRDITERKQARRPKMVLDAEYVSPAMRSVLSRARHAASTDSVILLQGESGTGKDHLARYIHTKSKRSGGPFYSINCAALSQELAESELFGHEAGAFTGARTRKRGLLELAEGGTLLLNEVGELSLAMQAKLLTFLDTKSFTRVGGERTIHVNARFIAATHRDLKAEVDKGRFLEALFYRLDVFSITLPTLEERLEDLPMLVEEITAKLAAEMDLPRKRLHPEEARALAGRRWPGNVRELRNVIERALILPANSTGEATLSGRPGARGAWTCAGEFPPNTSLLVIQRQIARSLCEEALRRAKGNKKKAARLLGISRYSFYRRLNSGKRAGEKETLKA